MASVFIDLPASTVSIPTGASTELKQDAIISELQLKADLTETQPVLEGDVTASGTISTRNLTPSAAATANSTVEISCEGKNTLVVQVVGTYTGTLGFQYTINDAVWVIPSGAQVKRATDNAYTTAIGANAQGIYKTSCAGYKKIRISMDAAMTGSVVCTLVVTKAEYILSIPFLETTTAAMSAKLPATLGTKTSALSMSVVLASDQATVPVSGPLTDAQLRATPVPVSAGTDLNTSALNLEATQALIKAKTDNIPALGQALAASSVPVVLTAAQITTLTPPAAITGFALDTSIDALRILNGAVTETAPATDTASSGLNGRLQRIAQNISAMILQLPATLGIKTAAASLSIAPASDAIFNTKDKALTGSYAENLTLTTVSTFTAPANAIGAIVQADDANAANFRAKQGAVATASSGVQFQAGRSEKFDSGTDISVCSEGASVKVYVQWFIQA